MYKLENIFNRDQQCIHPYLNSYLTNPLNSRYAWETNICFRNCIHTISNSHDTVKALPATICGMVNIATPDLYWKRSTWLNTDLSRIIA